MAHYETGTNILNDALLQIGLGSNATASWPGSLTALRWINAIASEASRLMGGTFKQRVEVSFQDGETNETYYDFTGTDPTRFKLLEVFISDEPQTIVDMDVMRFFRENSYRPAPVNLVYNYVFAVNRFPGEASDSNPTPGTVRIEMHPSAPTDAMTVEFLVERPPTTLTALTATVYVPYMIMVAGVAAIAATHKQHKMAGDMERRYRALCEQERRYSVVTKTPGQTGAYAGWLADRSMGLD